MITERQTTILIHLAHGMTYQEVADELGITHETVRNTLTGAYERLGTQTGASGGHSMIEAFRALGWLRPPEIRQ